MTRRRRKVLSFIVRNGFKDELKIPHKISAICVGRDRWPPIRDHFVFGARNFG